MRWLLMLLLWCVGGTWPVAARELVARFPKFVRADEREVSLARGGVRVTYLGTNAYLLEAAGAVLLVDPYFSRQGLLRMALSLEAKREPERVREWLREHPRIDGVLVTHSHVDHILDAPQILEARGAMLFASETGVQIAAAEGVNRRQLRAVRAGDRVRIAAARVRVLPAVHDRVLGSVPHAGPVKRLPPRSVGDWVVGEPLAFLIEMGGQRIFINSGSVPGAPLPQGLGWIDLAILGVAVRDAQRSFGEELRVLKPRWVLPSHQDDFFRPLERGFRFLPGSDFRCVRQVAQAQGRALLLLDYFRPWTLR